MKSEAIHETGLSGNVVASFFPLIIFILLCFNVLSTVPRENRLADFLYLYIIIYLYIIVTNTLRLTKVHHARRINEDSQSKPHSKHERRELKNARMDNF